MAERRPRLVRTLTAVLAGLLAASAVARLIFVIGDSQHDWASVPFAYVVPATLAIGGLIYTAASWRNGRWALVARRVGWGLMVGALMIPSTFTLGLPLLVPLALTLGRPAPLRGRYDRADAARAQ